MSNNRERTDFVLALRQLVRRCPAAGQVPALQNALTSQVNLQPDYAYLFGGVDNYMQRNPHRNSSPTQVSCPQAADREALLVALKSLLVEPACTLPTLTICRPAVLTIVASLVEDSLGCDGAAGGQPAVSLAVALVLALKLAAHTER